MKIDHHIHTSRHSPDSSIDPVELVERASSIGLDGSRDHRARLPVAGRMSSPIWRRGRRSLRVFSGAEISARGALPGLWLALARGRAAGHSREGPDRSRSAA